MFTAPALRLVITGEKQVQKRFPNGKALQKQEADFPLSSQEITGRGRGRPRTPQAACKLRVGGSPPIFAPVNLNFSPFQPTSLPTRLSSPLSLSLSLTPGPWRSAPSAWNVVLPSLCSAETITLPPVSAELWLLPRSLPKLASAHELSVAAAFMEPCVSRSVCVRETVSA